MDQNKFLEIKTRMVKALALIKEAVDLSIPLLGSVQRQEIVTLWEDFLREFLSHIRSKNRQTGQNLFACLSFKRIWTR